MATILIDVPKISPRSAHYPIYAQYMPEINIRNAQGMSKICLTNAQNMPQICPRYAKDMPKIC